MSLASVSLDDKYRLEQGRVFLTGVQALARLPMLQHQRDAAAGLNTAGYVSGYRGSPLGGLDTALQGAKAFLQAHHVTFHPAVNEDLAATAIWGTQQLHLFPEPRYDGVFAMWYGKGPGVDRSVDVLKNANYAGSAKHGGVLLVAGDDPGARSSSVAHQSEHVFSACGIPVLAPASIQEYLDLGLHGWAMSRYSGCWVALKTTADTVESSASVEVDPARLVIRLPEDFQLPPDGVHLRWPDPQLVQERRMQEYKVYAAIAYARANRLNRLVFDAPRARLGIIACGKAYLDVRQALDDLGIDERVAADIGLRLYKVAMPWPLDAEGVRHFAEGLEEILVVEEKRQIIEYQLKEQLYNWRADVRPRVVGKFADSDEWMPEAGRFARGSSPAHAAATRTGTAQVVGAHGHWLLPPTGELTPAIVARAIASRLARFHGSPQMRERVAFLEAKEAALARPRVSVLRTPWFCSGCPHNQSTKVPQGSCAVGGVGCHLMAVWMGRSTTTIAQMGGEGVSWLGIAPHSGTRHIFANMGDGTYYHSGLLAIRAAVAANVNITYKILYNDAVAMTGGQPVDGPITVPQITRQLAAEGVGRIVVLAEEPRHYPNDAGFAPGVQVRAREDLDAVQRELRETTGVTALIYDQTCAAEKRRRRKRGTFPDPATRVYINELVCEGCGDCSAKSNCLSVVPVETEFGRKRAIDQFSCNKDYSCVAGFCPSIVTVEGGTLRRGQAIDAPAGEPRDLPEPALPELATPWNIVVAGVGGTGVITIGALVGMAAHIEGKGVSVLDMTGLAQKGGAVMSHVRIADQPQALHAARVATGEADLLLGCDLIVAVSDDALSKTRGGKTRAIVNTGQAVTGDFVRNPDFHYPLAEMKSQVTDSVGDGAADFVDASRLAALLMGHSIAANIFMLGYAWQKGLVPVSQEALMRAIELNGVAAAENHAAFLWGRRTACDPAGVERLAAGAEPEVPTHRLSNGVDEVVARRREFLVAYQNEACARRYEELVERVRRAERAVSADSTALTGAVAHGWFRLLARKDAYEVARLYTDGEFERALRATFEGDFRLRFHFSVPQWGAVDPGTGEPRKHRYGAWMMPVLRVLAKLKFLRDTPFDPFGRGAERRLERTLIREYESTVDALLDDLQAHHLDIAAEIARLPESVRGYGPIRQRNADAARKRQAELMAALRAPVSQRAPAEVG
jgi:indolepyruvate ferredoxin oxidoreductase